MTRTEVPYQVARLMGDRPVRWASPALLLGDYDGRERTLEVFNAEPKDQLRLRAALRPLRDAIKEAAGGPIIIIFHTQKESTERYVDFIESFPRMVSRPPMRPLSVAGRIDVAAQDDAVQPHRRVA